MKPTFSELMNHSTIMIRAFQAAGLRTVAKSLAPHADEQMQVSDFIELLNTRADELGK